MSKKIKIVVPIIVLVIIVIGAIVGYFTYKHIEQNKSVGTLWGDTYYAYLKEATSEESNKEEYGLKEGMKNAQLQFVEVGEVNPVMVMTYEMEEDSYINIYKVNGENQVDKIIYREPSTVEFLYDIEKQSYSWYLHTENEIQDSYQLLLTILENSKENNEADYIITKDETTTQETLSGDIITLSKFDEIFVKPSIDPSKKVDFSTNMESKELKESIVQGVDGYKQQEEIVTEEVKAETETKVTELETTKKSIETAKAEIKAEEERKAAEELAKGLKVGNHTLKYGTYVSDVAQMDGSLYGTITLEPNGKFHIKANCEGGYPYPTLNCDGTYKVGKVQNSFEYFDGVIFTPNVGESFSFEVVKDNAFSDQWHGYSYTGN